MESKEGTNFIKCNRIHLNYLLGFKQMHEIREICILTDPDNFDAYAGVRCTNKFVTCVV